MYRAATQIIHIYNIHAIQEYNTGMDVQVPGQNPSQVNN